MALVALLLLAVGQVQAARAATIGVTTTTDELNSDGDCSLREAIQAANSDAGIDACGAGAGADTINVPAGTYTTTIAGSGENAGDLDILSELAIEGSSGSPTVVDGGALGAVFDVGPGMFGLNVSMSHLTIRNGVRGIVNQGGVLTLNSSTVTGNTADGGGGIYNGIDDSLTLNNSTVSGNAATSGVGGGIVSLNDSTLTLNNSTIAGNTASSSGDGISLFSGATATAKNTIIANNGQDCASGSSPLVSAGHNLIEGPSTCTIVGDTTGNIIGVDPVLGPLQYNGGPTNTHALLAGSPAIDAGSPDCPPPATDQRGLARPQNSSCDIGAVERCAGTDTDGDGLTDSCEAIYSTGISDPDTDSDGCKDGAEVNNPPSTGGGRNPTNFWDFMDVPTGNPLARDQAVSGGDISAIVGRFGANDIGPGDFDRNSDPLSTPNLPVTPSGARSNYHPAYDRGGTVPGGDPWDLNPADGSVAGGDISAAVVQFGHNCI
ncbi:MAG: choice-of-anchor Q domain-containing protein [Solirubrobacterales bacterium]